MQNNIPEIPGKANGDIMCDMAGIPGKCIDMDD